MLSQTQSRYLTTIGFALLALLFASDLLLKPPKELVSLAIACISALYFTATLFVGLKERKKGAVVASAVGVGGVRTISWTAPRRIQASCGTPSGSATRGTS